jgi:predicted N-acyltransferase
VVTAVGCGVLSLREYANVEDLPRDAWDRLVRESGAAMFFDSHLLAGVARHSIEAPLAIRYFAISEGDELVAAAVAYALRRSIWWSYYEELIGGQDVFGGPWIAMPSVFTWSGDVPLRPGSDAAEVAALLVAAGRRFADDHRAVALAVTNATREAALTAPLRALADLAIFLDNNAVIPTHASFEAYVAALETDVRHDFRRVRRRAAERGCRWLTYSSGDYPPGAIEKLLDLVNGGATRRDQDAVYTLELLAALAAAPSARLLLAVAGEPVAGFLVHEDATRLYVQAGGWDATRKDLSPFVNIVHELVMKAHEWNKVAIEFGRTNYRFKRKHGSRLIPLYGLFYLTERADPGLGDRLAALERGIAEFVAGGGGDVVAPP